jgi:hypothetical protein
VSKFSPTVMLILAALCVSRPCFSVAQEPSADGWSAMTNATTALIAEVNTGAVPFAEVTEAFDGQTIRIAIDLPYSQTHPILRVYSPRESPRLAELLRHQLDNIDVGGGEQEGDWWRYDVSLWPVDRDNLIGDEILNRDRPELLRGLDRAGDGPIRIAFSLPDYFGRIVARLSPTLPESLGGGESRVLLNDVRFVALGIDPEAKAVDFNAQMVSDDAAKAFAEQLPKSLASLSTLLPIDDEWTERLSSIRMEIDGDQVHWRTELQLLVLAAEFSSAGAAERRARMRQSGQLKRLGLAIHNYVNAHKSFPPAKEARDENGEPRLSWRVHILPFIGQADLYAEFRLDESWDSEHNRRLIERMPDIFSWPGVPRGKTVVQAPMGDGTIFGGNRPVTFQDITDGTSNTAMLVYTAPNRAVTWTAPEDFRFDPERPQEGLDRDVQGLAIVGAADGSVRRVPVDLPPQTWQNIFRMNDGQLVRW